MKKLLAMLLSLIMVFSLVPLAVSAAEMETSSHSALVDKAVVAFPEYAERLLNPSYFSTRARGVTDSVLVVKETRPISDTESITYAEYSDGRIFLSDYDFTYDTPSANSSGTSPRTVTIDIEAEALLYGESLGSFYLDNVKYELYPGYYNYDRIVYAGTGTRSGGCTNANRGTYNQYEDLQGYAELTYELRFRVNSSAGGYVDSTLSLYVGEDTAVIDHIGWL